MKNNFTILPGGDGEGTYRFTLTGFVLKLVIYYPGGGEIPNPCVAIQIHYIIAGKKEEKERKKKKNKFDVLRNRVHLDEERFADHADLPYLKRIPWRRARARRTQMSPEGARGRARAGGGTGTGGGQERVRRGGERALYRARRPRDRADSQEAPAG